MTRIECTVHLVKSDKVTNIRMFEDEGDVCLQHLGIKHDGGDSMRVEFRYENRVLVTSENDDGYPTIGLDFTWTYTKNFKKIKYVYLYLKEDNCVKLRPNGDVQVSPCDEKEYSEKDVITMLSYAVGYDKNKVDEIINWFKLKDDKE